MFHPRELAYEWAVRTNRPRFAMQRPSEVEPLWHVAHGAFPWSASPTRPRWLVVTTTFRRPAEMQAQLHALREAVELEGSPEDVSLLVLQDACGSDYSAAERAAARSFPGSTWLRATSRLGKPGFWKVHQTALFWAQALAPERALYLQDDVRFAPDLLSRVRELWEATRFDPRRAVLYLYASSDDERWGRWTWFRRKSLPHLGCRQTNWFDLQAFVVDRRFFELLDHRLVPIDPNRFRRRPAISSGVGRQLTLRLRRAASVYQAWPPLVTHGGDESQMNPVARSRRALDNHTDFRARRAD